MGKTSLAWEHFRHSNVVSTSAPLPTQVSNGEGGDSDGAEEDGFVGGKKNGSEEMMMQIMDKYVQAGEALAWKENEVLDLTKQVQEARAVNSDLEARVSHLTTSNEKLLDSEGRWYSLARELENQMDVIKKGETYSLFQDKVDEAEARLEVATDANATCRRRLFEVYGVVDADFKDKNNDGGDEDVDEHRLHATILQELQHLKSATTDIEDALAASRDANSAAELARQQAQAREAELRSQLEIQVSKLREEAAARDASIEAEQDALRDAFAKQAQELEQALEEVSRCREASMEAQASFQAAEDARRAAVELASTRQSNLSEVREDYRLAQLHIQSVEGRLVEARAALEASQQEVETRHEAQGAAESSMQHLSDRVANLEGLLEESRSRSSQVERDLADSSHQIAELRQVAEVCRGEVAEAMKKSAELQACVDMQEGRLHESLERETALSDTLQTLRNQLDERDAAVRRAQSEAERALQKESAATEGAERLRQELEKMSADASTTREYATQVEGMREELERATADASAAREYAAQVQAELEKATAEASTISREYAAQVEGLREELDRATADASASREHAAQVQADLEGATAEASTTTREFEAQVKGLREELDRAKADASDARERAACAQELRQELKAVTAAAATAAQESAEQATKLRQELEYASAAAASAQEHATHSEGLRTKLESANAALLEAQNGAALTQGLQEELDMVKSALSGAQDNAARSNEARLASEAHAQRTEEARADAEAQVDSLRQRLALKETPVQHLGSEAEGANADSVAAEHAAATTSEALAKAREDVVRAEARSTSAIQACEESQQKVARLQGDVRDLETQLSEAKASETRLGERLVASQAELAERAAELARNDGADVIAAPSPPPVEMGTAPSSPAPDHGVKASNGGGEGIIGVANGVAPASRSAEAEQLKAQAEAMELELRYTLESFEGQLSAMAREKVAMQRQLKELTEQRTTLRKQVSHFKKVAKESEAQVEQMLELQQQLCDAESAAESLRDANSDLRNVNRDLTSKLEILESDDAKETYETMWRQSQDEVVELRARLLDAEENAVVKAQELATKVEQAASAQTLADTLEQRVREFECEVSELKRACLSTEEELTSALASASELRCAASNVAKLESVIGDLEAEKHQWTETAAARTCQIEELEQVVRSLEQEKARISQTAQQTEDGRAALVLQLRDIANSVGCERSDGEAIVSSLLIPDKIALLTRRVAAAEGLVEAAAKALQQASIEGEVELESESSWIINGIISLQRRLHVAESELTQRSEILQDSAGHGEATKMLEELSALLECDEERVVHKVHELKKLAHELFELRDTHLREIQQLKHNATTRASTPSSNESSTSQMFPGGDVGAVREQNAVLQVTIDTLKNEVREAQQLRAKDAEKHRREETRLQERHEALIRFSKDGANGGASKDPRFHDNRSTLHRKCSSLQLGTSSAVGWLSELAEIGHGAKLNGDALSLGLAPSGPARVRSNSMRDSPEANGGDFADGGQMISRGTDVAFDESEVYERSKSAAVLEKIQALLGCTMEEVTGVLSELQAASQEKHLMTKALGDVKHSYFNNMESLASAIGHEAASQVSPLLTQASALCSEGACLTSTQEGLEILDEATSILTRFLQRSTTANAEIAEVAQRQAQKEVAAVNETLRKERLMMMAFRRWGHFYLALSNEALRKRTKEQNQARHQRDTPEKVSLSVMERPRKDRRSSSAGRRTDGQGQLQLSSSDVQVMVEQEAESVARELAGEPSLSLLALADARKEMDDIAMKAQATLGELYAQPPRTQDANVATDGVMMGIVDQLPEEKKPEKNVQKILSASSDPASASVEAAVVDSAALAPPTVLDVASVHEVPEKDIVDSGGGENGTPTPPPPTSLPAPPSPTPPPMVPPTKINADQDSNTSERGRKIAPAVNPPPVQADNAISKKERAEFLKKQREERKAKRKEQASKSIRNRRTSVPTTTPPTVEVPSEPAAPSIPATPPRTAFEVQRPDEVGPVQAPSMPTKGNEEAESRRATPPVVPPPTKPDSASEVVAATPPAVKPPPTFFNPTNVPPPPVGPPSAATSSHAQPSRHPSIAFNVNETVERALTEARREAGVAERSAAFWKCRFRDLAVWSASFVVLTYASDHSFEQDC